MNERQEAERFERDLARLLATGAVPDEAALPEAHRQRLEVARRLATRDFSALSAVRQPLRRRLMSQPRRDERWTIHPSQGADTMTPTTSTSRRALFLGATLVALLALATLSAPGRTLAEGLLHRIGLISLSSAPTDAEQMAGEPVPTPQPGGQGAFIPAVVLPLAEASAAAGFPVYDVSAAPEGYRLVSRTVEHGPGGAVTVRSEHQLVAGELSAGGTVHYLILSQDRYPAAPPPLAVGDAPVTEVTVRGQPGLWVADAALLAREGAQGQIEAAGMGLLLWEEEGMQLGLAADALTLPELLAIAEGLSR